MAKSQIKKAERQANGQSDGGAKSDPHGCNGVALTRSTNVEPIAIIGMGMRLPGGVRDATGFWDLLVNGRTGRCRVPANRYAIDTWYGPGQPMHIGTRYGNFLQDYNPAHIDTSFWSMSKEEVETMDPEQRLLLEVVYEAFESSGWRDFRGDEIGVYVGTMGSDWDRIEQHDNQNLEPVRADIYGDYILANRVSYEFDLKGPSIVLRTACSSSLSALHMACQDIRSGECTSAMVCGTNLIITPRDTALMTEQGVLSPAGTSRSFDADADGYGRGEAVNAILVKKLSDAIRDKDPVRAVIRNTCISGDGKTPGLTVPNPSSHEKLIRRAYRAAGISDLSTVAMVECHGTGTAVGDPIEIEAIANVWGENGIQIGSVKPNIGHGEGASGLSSVIKMVLALENHTIPPNVNFKTPNPRIPWEEAKLTVPVSATPWPQDRLERVSINSFGIGGANAHVILESPTCSNTATASLPALHCLEIRRIQIEGMHYLIPFSAKSKQSTLKRVEQVKTYLSENPKSLNDVAHSLSAGRESHCFRAFSIVSGSGGILESPAVISQIPAITTPLVWVFTGQGAQWAEMGKELIERVPLASQRLDELQSILDNLSEPPSWTIRDALLAPEGKSRLYEAEISQPCLAAIQIILADVLRSWGVVPAAVVGHSSGETAAGYAAGVITAKDAMILAYHRGQITPPLKVAHRGGMAAVGMGREEIAPYLQEGVIVGCENSPSSVSLSGDIDVLEKVMEDIRQKRPGVLCRPLQVECGYHSPHMFAIRDNFDTRVSVIAEGKQPAVPFYSTVTGKLNAEFPRKYWSTNMVSPVLFSTAVETLLADFPSVSFIELGPHSAMSGPIRQILQKSNRTADYIPTLVRRMDGHASILRTAGQLWAKGHKIDISTVNLPGKLLTDLPSYPWHYDAEYWVESRISRGYRFRRFRHHELLGVRVLDTGDAVPAWRCKLRVGDVPWLRDHTIDGDILLPATGYISMIGEAIRQLTGSKDYSVRKVKFLSPLIIGDEPVEIITALVPLQDVPGNASPWYDFSISSLNGETWTRLVVGQSRGGSTSLMPQLELSETLPRNMSNESFYYACQRRGLAYGRLFRGLSEISSHLTEGKAKGTVPDLIPASQYTSHYAIHPTVLDSCLHICMASACRGLERNFRTASVPKTIEAMYIAEKSLGPVLVKGETDDSQPNRGTANVVGTCDEKVVLHLRGLEVAQFSTKELADDDPHAATILEWKADIDFISPSRLFTHSQDNSQILRLNRLALACILKFQIEFATLEGHSPHLAIFRDKLATIHQAAIKRTYASILDYQELVTMKSNARHELIQEILGVCMRDSNVVRQLASRIYWTYSHAKTLLSIVGTSDRQPRIEPAYRAQASTLLHSDIDMTAFFAVLTHQNPNLRILQIGASSSNLLNTLLAKLRSKQGVYLFDSFTVTGTNQSIVEQAKYTFKHIPSMDFSTIDTSRQLVSQGLKEAYYDLVVVSESNFERGKSPTELLHDISKLLQPKGRLLIHDINPDCAAMGYIAALQPSWCLSREVLGNDAWLAALTKSGFDDKSASIFEGVSSRIIVACPVTTAVQSTKSIAVLCHDKSHPHISALTSFLVATREIEVSFVTVGDVLPPGHLILSLLDLEGPFLHDITPDMFIAFKKSLVSMEDARMLWVTKACQIDCREPNHALTIGALRTIRHETSADVVTLELDRYDSKGWQAVADLVGSLKHRTVDDEAVEPDSEFVSSNGEIQISRFRSIKVIDELTEPPPSGPRTLMVKKTTHQHVEWIPSGKTDLTDSSVEVKVRCMTMSKSGSFGFEGSGIVTRIGQRAGHIKTGDRVVFFGGLNCSTSIIASEAQCVKITDSMSFLEAATIPRAYMQATYALENVARLCRGQPLLIVGACSATGLAAIQIAQLAGAEIYCAVVGREEALYLNGTCDISEDHLLSYGTSSWLQALDEQSFEVVLNLAPNENRETLLDCIAPFGIFINIMDSDSSTAFLQRGNLSRGNRTYVSVDVAELARHRAHLCQRILARTVELQQQGQIQSRLSIKAFDAASAAEALTRAQNDNIKGWEQIVLMFPDDVESSLQTTSSRLTTRLHPDRTYVFVGGLGGLGQAIARFLVEKGARHLIFFSRSAKGATEKYSDYIKELEHQGCNVQAISGDVSIIDDVRKMVAAATHPIGGVLHAAMVLQDINFTDMAYAQWQTCVLPKVRGTWNLHNVLRLGAQPVDFFFLFSSVSGLGGPVGQANYAAGNAFLDAFVQYRQSLGWPCSVLDIGMMRGIGILEKETYRLEAMRAESLHALHEQDLLDALELMLARSHPGPEQDSSLMDIYTSRGQMAIGMRVGNTQTTSLSPASWQRDPRTLLLHKIMPGLRGVNQREPGEASLKEFFNGCNANPSILKTDKSIMYLANEIVTALSKFRMREDEALDLDTSLDALGVDSLLSVELRRWFKQKLGVVLKMPEIRGATSAKSLARLIARKISERLETH